MGVAHKLGPSADLSLQQQSLSMSEEFNKAAQQVKDLTERPSNEELLDLYGYFKQTTVGDINTDRPGMFYMKDRAKWDNWESRKGTSKEDAEKKYIQMVKDLLAKYPSKI